MDLKNLGLSVFFENYLKNNTLTNLKLGRISAQYREHYNVISEYGEVRALVSGHFRHNAASQTDFPCVGDFVAVAYELGENQAIIQNILPRKSKFSRQMASEVGGEQIICSNVDFAFIVSSLNYDFNLARIERYLSLVWQSGAIPVVILTKSDLCADTAAKINTVKDRAIGVDVWSISNLEIDSLQPLQKYFTNHKTVVLLGSSGVGKSTLVNNLAGEEILKTNELRSDVEKGRHTTTTRQMIYLKNGGWVIDTPGMRELGLWDAQAGISQTFTDITDLVKQCKFSNCTHTNEPGCAVQTAIREGRLEIARFKNFDKMQKEQQYIEARQTQSAAKIERDKWKSIHKQIKLLKY